MATLMKAIPILLRGKRRFKVELVAGGKRKRQFFKTRKLADAAVESARKDQEQLGTAWKVHVLGCLGAAFRNFPVTMSDVVRHCKTSRNRKMIWRLYSVLQSATLSLCLLGTVQLKINGIRFRYECKISEEKPPHVHLSA